MSIDFKAEVEKRREPLMEDLFSILRINSERDDAASALGAPFGPGPTAAMKKVLELAERDGFSSKNVDGYVGEFEYGDGAETLGIFAHMDVVPAGTGWDSNPYEPEIREGKLYARGSSDDKGPTMACYYGLKILKDLDIKLSKKVKFIIGTNEESGWADMDYYFAQPGVVKPDFGFSPDAEFPIINGEKGIVTEYLNFNGDNAGTFTLHSFKSGLAENMVPESATAVFSGSDIKADFEKYMTDNKMDGEISEADGKYTFTLKGVSSHGAKPENGINGGTFLARFLMSYDFGGSALNFLTVAGEFAWNDHTGKKFGYEYFSDEMQVPLSTNPSILAFEEGSTSNVIANNIRYPKGITSDDIKAAFEKTVGNLVRDITISDHNMTPHYVPNTDPLVTTLLDVYSKHTGQDVKGYEEIIGGGTFGRLVKRGVAFGAQFPGFTDTMHQKNEYMEVEDIYRAAAIYAEAIYELAK